MTLIEQMAEALEELTGKGTIPLGLDSYEIHMDTMEKCCKALTALRSGELVVNEWISVKDRMPPDDNCWVLVCADGAMNVMAWYDGKWCDWVKTRNSNIVVSEISHWMSLPAEPVSKE